MKKKNKEKTKEKEKNKASELYGDGYEPKQSEPTRAATTVKSMPARYYRPWRFLLGISTGGAPAAGEGDGAIVEDRRFSAAVNLGVMTTYINTNRGSERPSWVSSVQLLHVDRASGGRRSYWTRSCGPSKEVASQTTMVRSQWFSVSLGCTPRKGTEGKKRDGDGAGGR